MGNPTIENVPLLTSEPEHSPQNEPSSSSSSLPVLDHPDTDKQSPPAYEDIEAEVPISREAPTILYSLPSKSEKALITFYPRYSTDSDCLETMIQEQSTFPPTLKVQIQGTHLRRVDANRSKITDFDFNIDMTDLLPSESKICVMPLGSEHRPLGITPPDLELIHDVGSLCQKYTSDKTIAKTFKFSRKVVNLPEDKLKEMISDLIKSTAYRGEIQINFNKENEHVMVLSPCFVNKYRTAGFLWLVYLVSFILFIVWLFKWRWYLLVGSILAFLFTHPLLGAATHNYALLEAEYEFPPEHEDQFVEYWKENIKRAVLSKENSGPEKVPLDQKFRKRTAEILASTSHLTPGTETDRIRYGVWGNDDA